MRTLSPHRTIVDPGDVTGIPSVHKHTPIPLREKPLPGTKSLLCPEDSRVGEMIRRRPPLQLENSGSAGVCGALSMILSLGFVGLFGWVLVTEQGPGNHWALAVILGLGLVHVLAVFSQVLSSGRNLPGALAVPVLYVGGMLAALIAHLFS